MKVRTEPLGGTEIYEEIIDKLLLEKHVVVYFTMLWEICIFVAS